MVRCLPQIRECLKEPPRCGWDHPPFRKGGRSVTNTRTCIGYDQFPPLKRLETKRETGNSAIYRQARCGARVLRSNAGLTVGANVPQINLDRAAFPIVRCRVEALASERSHAPSVFHHGAYRGPLLRRMTSQYAARCPSWAKTVRDLSPPSDTPAAKADMEDGAERQSSMSRYIFLVVVYLPVRQIFPALHWC